MQRTKLPLIVFLGTLFTLGMITAVSEYRKIKTSILPPDFGTNSSRIYRDIMPAAGHFESFDERTIMRVVVSLAVLASSLFVILRKKYDTNDKKWAYGSVGAILGFWLGG